MRRYPKRIPNENKHRLHLEACHDLEKHANKQAIQQGLDPPIFVLDTEAK